MTKQVFRDALKTIVASIFYYMLSIGMNDIYSQEIQVGTQIWYAKNLDVSKFRNGDTIPEAKTNDEWQAANNLHRPVWCYYKNDSNYSRYYGKLYNWYALNDHRQIARVGWHIPSDAEWKMLSEFLENIKDINVKEEFISNLFSVNGGERECNGNFRGIDEVSWWSSTEDNAYEETNIHKVWYRLLDSPDDDPESNPAKSVLIRAKSLKCSGRYVLCIKD